MPDGQLIEFDHVTKRFGAVAAVSDFTARVNPGVVTGFLGPNGAGKTTTLRMLLGLERPTIGTTKIGGKRFSELRHPARVIGAMLEDPGFRARRTVERHLTATAKANGIDLSRVDDLISFVGLGDDVDTRVSALSLGMRQRLSAATALLGDPGVLVLDEPANGLDPEGIRWMRTLIRGLADEGRTVLVSSHVLSEVEQTADEILIIAHGQLKFAGTMEDLADPSSGPVVVDAVDRVSLANALRSADLAFEVLRSGLTVRGSDAATVGRLTASAGVALTTLQQRGPTLEDVFLDLVNDRFVRAAEPSAEAVVEPVADPSTGSGNGSADETDPSTRSGNGSTDETDPSTGSGSGSAEVTDPSTGSGNGSGSAEVTDPSTGSGNRNADQTDPSTRSGNGNADQTDPSTRSGNRNADETDPSTGSGNGNVDPSTGDTGERQLPGIDGLAAVASLFATPAPTDSVIDSVPAAGNDDPQHDDLDETRAIEVIPTGYSVSENAHAEASDSAHERR